MQFNFYRLKVQRAEQCNATEVDGAGQLIKGAIWHPDTIAHVVRYHYAQQYIERLAPGSQVLDLGCGELQLLRYLQMNRCQWPKDTWYWGYDLRAKHAWCKHLVNGPAVVNLVRQSALAEWPSDFPTSYELIICYEMFEHVPIADQPRLLQRLYNLVRPGGVVLFSTPNGGRRLSPVANHRGSDGDRERTYRDKVAMVSQSGFEIVDQFGTGCRVPNLRDEALAGTCGRAKKYLPLSLYLGFVSLDQPKESNGSTFALKRSSLLAKIGTVAHQCDVNTSRFFLKLNKRRVLTMFSKDVMFVDLDGDHTLEELDKLCRKLKWHARAYCTAGGWRLLEIGKLQPVDDRILKVLAGNGVDERYIKICRGSKAWRARLKPKARRLGLSGDNWDQYDYDSEHVKYSTCRFMGEVGEGVYHLSNSERDHVNEIVALHDEISQAFSPLPLR